MGAIGGSYPRDLSSGGRTLTAPASAPRVALVHDWLTGMRGGEKTIEPVCASHPSAELFTLLHIPGSTSPTIENRPIHTSFIQRLPGVERHYRQYLPLFPTAIERFSFERFDLVLSFSHCVAKSVITPADVPHICYCFTPMRYAWDQFDAYFGADRVGRLASRVMQPIMARMADWDRRTSTRATRYLAISQYVAQRIRRYYNRDATIVYPPVDTDFFSPDASVPADHFLIVSALVPYKRIDLAIEACRRLGAPLRIVGDGPERAYLERIAGPTVEFLGRRSDEEVRREYRIAAAVLLPGEEDFGIVPVEAQACGRPVVALGLGGALETVVDDETGVLAREATVTSFAAALERFRRQRFDTARIRAHAEQFSTVRYLTELNAAVAETCASGRASW